MKPILAIVSVILSCSVCMAVELPRSTPEAQGVRSEGILSFIETAEREIDALHSIMVLRHGHVVAEGWWAPYNADSPHMLYSLSKSFTSTAVGLAIAEGKLSLEDEVLKFFPDVAPDNPGDNLKRMRVHDLLRMSTGHQIEPPRTSQKWTQAFLAHPVPFKPGTHFQYNTSATYMLSAMVQKATGKRVLDYLKPRLFDPLGIENPTWEVSPEGISTGGYGLSVRTEDIARFGQLYLQKGKWQGKQLVPEAWIEAATKLQTSNGSNPNSDWDQGYGYQFWRCRHGVYRGDGAFGQYCIVLDDKDAVIAITSGVRNMQAVLDLVWDKLLPAMTDDGPLSSDDEASKKLRTKLANLSLPKPEGAASGPDVMGKTYSFRPNDGKIESITLEDDGDRGATIVVQLDNRQRRILCGRGQWRESRLAWGPMSSQPVASCGAWTDAETFTAKVCFYETPYIHTVRLRFTGQEMQFSSDANVAFGARTSIKLKGQME